MRETVFVTGATGYLGSYACQALLAQPHLRLQCLLRSPNLDSARDKLWRAWQLHLSAAQFAALLPRVECILGDLTATKLGLSAALYDHLCTTTDSVLHIAAALNRKSEKACLNTNLRGTLATIQLAQAIHHRRGLRRFSTVSTVGIAGKRHGETLGEEEALDWQRADYDPYGRSKKFAEHMVCELLTNLPVTVFRPSIILGDSRHPRTTQFDMVRAFCALVDLPVLPLRPDSRLDIVNVDFVAAAMVDLHLRADCPHRCYHLSAGTASPTAQQIADHMAKVLGRRPPQFAPWLSTPFRRTLQGLSQLPGPAALAQAATLIQVFLPYIEYDTVFTNTRIVATYGQAPTPFLEYAAGLYQFAKKVGFRYPYLSLEAV